MVSTYKTCYREFTLNNGLFVALMERPTQTISGRLRINYGALNEMEGEEGLAHLLEHTLLNGGTQKYDPNKADEIIATFGYFNATTGLDATYFSVSMLPEDLELYLDFVSDLAFDPRLDALRVKEEKERVLREIADDKGYPLFKDEQDFYKALFGNSPETYFTSGKESVVTSATLDDLRAFYSRGYHANNMDLILVGSLSENVEELIIKYFEGRPTGKGKKFQFPALKPLEYKVILHTLAPELNNHDSPEESNAQIYLGFIVPDRNHEDTYALSILVDILCGDPNSRLYKTISQRKGLAYRIGGYYDGSNNRGLVIIRGNVLSTKQDEAIGSIFDEITKLKSELIDEGEVNRVIRDNRYRTAGRFETNDGHIREIEQRLDYGRTAEMFLEKIAAVTPEKIREAAIKYLPGIDGNYVLMIRDPLKK